MVREKNWLNLAIVVDSLNINIYTVIAMQNHTVVLNYFILVTDLILMSNTNGYKFS